MRSRRLLPILALLLGPGLACASDLEISPLSVHLNSQRGADILYVSNQGAATVSIQARGYVWEEEGNDDRLTETRDIVLSPPIFRIEPGKKQLLRVIAKDPKVAKERMFRVLLDELPGPPEENTVRVVFRVSLPVFVAPADSAQAALRWQAVRSGNTVQVLAANEGGLHTKITDFSVLLDDNTKLLPDHVGLGYVLPGATRAWTVSLPASASADELTVRGVSDAGPVNVRIPVASAR